MISEEAWHSWINSGKRVFGAAQYRPAQLEIDVVDGSSCPSAEDQDTWRYEACVAMEEV